MLVSDTEATFVWRLLSRTVGKQKASLDMAWCRRSMRMHAGLQHPPFPRRTQA